MVRSDNSWSVILLGPVPAFESVGDWYDLRINLHWLALTDKREQLSFI